MTHDDSEFADFFQASWEPCLKAVAASTGDMLLAEEQVAEAFARAWVSWRKVSRHPARRAWVVRTALNVGASRWRRRGRELPLIDHDVVAAASPETGLDADVLTGVTAAAGPAARGDRAARFPRPGHRDNRKDSGHRARNGARSPIPSCHDPSQGTLRTHDHGGGPMSDNDQLNNSAELHRLSGSLSGVTVPKPPPLDAIMARGRTRRRHRRYSVAGLFLAGAGIAAALLVGPTTAPAAPGAPGAPAPSRTLGAIHTAAYTIVLNSDGTATLTIDPNEIFDPEKLQSDLDQYGIPARVTVGSFCTSDPAPAGLSQVVSYESGQKATITIDPTAMPVGHRVQRRRVQTPAGRGDGHVRAHR